MTLQSQMWCSFYQNSIPLSSLFLFLKSLLKLSPSCRQQGYKNLMQVSSALLKQMESCLKHESCFMFLHPSATPKYIVLYIAVSQIYLLIDYPKAKGTFEKCVAHTSLHVCLLPVLGHFRCVSKPVAFPLQRLLPLQASFQEAYSAAVLDSCTPELTHFRLRICPVTPASPWVLWDQTLRWKNYWFPGVELPGSCSPAFTWHKGTILTLMRMQGLTRPPHQKGIQTVRGTVRALPFKASNNISFLDKLLTFFLDVDTLCHFLQKLVPVIYPFEICSFSQLLRGAVSYGNLISQPFQYPLCRHVFSKPSYG